MKLWATIKKDWLILLRDKVGLALMFGMPILLVLIVTSIQNTAFQSLTGSKVLLIISNKDTGRFSRELIGIVGQTGIYRLEEVDKAAGREELLHQMSKRAGVLAIVVPDDFSAQVTVRANKAADKALHSFGLEGDKASQEKTGSNRRNQRPPGSLDLLFNPGVDPALKVSTEGMLNGALQTVQSRQILKTLYLAINEKALPDSLEDEMLSDRMAVREIPLTRSNAMLPLNATQHNV